MSAARSVIEECEDVAKKGKQAAPGETWVAVRLPEAVEAWLRDVALREERSVSYILRRIVLDAYENARSRERKP